MSNKETIVNPVEKKEAVEQMVVTIDDIKEMSEVIGEEIIANDDEDYTQVKEIIRCDNIRMGEDALKKFKGVFRLNGRFVEKVGRPLSYNELKDEMPMMFDAIENIEDNPKDVIETDKDFTAALTVKSNEERALRRIEAKLKIIAKEQGESIAEEIKKQLLKTRELLKEEIRVVETMGVIWNESLVWDIWMIMRAKRQRKFMENDGLPVDYLIELYGNIPRKEFKVIKEFYKSLYD